MSTTLRQHAIPYFVPAIGDEEIALVVETLRSGWLTTGPKVKQFEQEFAERVGADCAVAVSSCTAALHLALEAVGIGPGDEVIIPTLTFASTGEVIQYLGATPVLADIDPETLLLDPDDVERKITARTRAVIPVHYGGQPCDMDRIRGLAAERGVVVIEDAAHAFPARYGDQMVGSMGKITCFSFYANKTITTGEGGMVTTNDPEIASRVRLMSLHGITKDAWKRFSAEGTWDYEIVAPGYKYNMTDLAAAIGLGQLAKAESLLARRRAIAAMYDALFDDVPALQLPVIELDRQTAWHLYVIRLQVDQLKIDRAAFIQQLAAEGIGTSVHYRPLHMHPLYAERYGYRPADLPVAEQVFRQIISLPLHARLSDEDVERVGQAVLRIVEDNLR